VQKPTIIFLYLGLFYQMGALSSAVGSGTVIQARMSGVPFLIGSMGFFINLILLKRQLVHWADNLNIFMCQLSRILGAWSSKDLSRPLTG
jgi:hypothetical protein